MQLVTGLGSERGPRSATTAFPRYLRGQTGEVRKVIEPALLDNEEEGYGRNAGNRRHYYRISVPMPALWPNYEGSPRDELLIEVQESWLEHAA